MLFNSIEFPFFLILIVTLHFLLPQRLRWILLWIGSYYFYMCWRAPYVLLLFFSTVLDYFCALKIAQNTSLQKRRFFLALSLLANLGMLFTFKYYNFFIQELHSTLLSAGISFSLPELQLLLPLGISFYTFQTLSYVVDVYRRHIEPERHFGYFALYVSFFPQLVAGPIERASRLLPQFREEHSFDAQLAIKGLRRILWGMFKKVVIADHLAFYVNAVFAEPQNYHGAHFWVATYFFAFQIYCDFSGYSDIAIGVAQMLGYDLMENFRRPYLARSIPEFWSRWHISLSTWFRDYLYIPLGGNRVALPRWYVNLFLVFLVSGIWHGANWTFLAWGALHGVYQILTVSYRTWFPASEKNTKIQSGLQIIITFHLVCLAWIFFRAENISEACYILTHLPFSISSLTSVTSPIGNTNFLLGFGYIFLLLLLEWGQEFFRWSLETLSTPWRWCCYYLLFFGILYLGAFESNEFIYFQF